RSRRTRRSSSSATSSWSSLGSDAPSILTRMALRTTSGLSRMYLRSSMSNSVRAYSSSPRRLRYPRQQTRLGLGKEIVFRRLFNTGETTTAPEALGSLERLLRLHVPTERAEEALKTLAATFPGDVRGYVVGGSDEEGYRFDAQ